MPVVECARTGLTWRRVTAGVAVAATALGMFVSAPSASADTATVTTWGELTSAFAAGGTVSLGADITNPAGVHLVVGPTAVTLDLNGHALSISLPAGNISGAGIRVASDRALTVQDTTGGGSLGVTGGTAGIGDTVSASGASTGSVTITGGTVTATGQQGAGIGSGSGNAGPVTISGGSVTATGGASSAGIGSGFEGDAATVTVSGGTVSATGGQGGAGIGTGYSNTGRKAGTVTLTGGSVTATGGPSGAGIGGGSRSSGANVTIGANASVTATEGYQSTFPSAIGAGGGRSDPFFGSLSNSGALTIPSGATLRIPVNASLTNNGTISGGGTVQNNGAILGSGTIDGNGQGPAGTNPVVSPNNYSLFYDLNGGSGTAPPTQHVYADTVNDGDQELPTRPEATFAGWYTAASGGTLVQNTSALAKVLGGSGPTTATLYAHFDRPVVTGVSPLSGPAAGGTTVTISGSNFTGANAVIVGGGGPATSVTVDSDTTITATTPAHAAGVANVYVRKPSGATSAAVRADHFTYLGAPAVTSVSPASGPVAGGQSVTITGSGFNGASAVQFGSDPASKFTVDSSTSITATTPAGVSGQAVDVTVTTPNGTSATGPVDQYTYDLGAPSTTWDGLAAAFAAGGVVTLGADITNPAGAHLTVGDTAVTLDLNGKSLTIAGVDAGYAAIEVQLYRSSFTVCDAAGGGTLTVTGGSSGAGIGGDSAGRNSGPVTVRGGTITATGGTDGAGIGGVGSGSFGADVSVTGGSVTATGSGFGSAIGGTDVGNLTIGSDGSVTATGGDANESALPLGEGGVSLTNAGSLTIPAGAKLWLPEGANVENSGTLYLAGPMTGIGTVHNTGSIQLSGAGSIADNGQGPASSTVLVEPGNYTLSFDVNGGPGSTPAAQQVYAGTVAQGGQSLPVLVRPGYTTGWYTAASGGDLITNSTDLGSEFGAGPQSATLYAQYTRNKPTITSLSPNVGPTAGGTAVTITGTDFTGATAVSFGSSSVPFTVVSDTQITTTSPAHGAGPTYVYVKGPAGTSPIGPAARFTYGQAPVVTSVSPSVGPVAGGNSVTVVGSGFVGVTSVRVGTTEATYSVSTSTRLTIKAPPGASGTVDIVVTATGGTSAAGAADEYTYRATPTVTGVSPNSGPGDGGQAVTITGTGFTGATSVSFSSVAATIVSVDSDTQITVRVPSHAKGLANVYVRTPGGRSAAVVADRYTYTSNPQPT